MVGDVSVACRRTDVGGDAYTAVYTQETCQYRTSRAKTAGLTYCEYKVLPEQRTQIYAEGVGNNSNRPVNASVRSRMGK